MLFRRKIARSCHYCSKATKLDDMQVLCIKRGIVNIDHSCRKFSYDPCKRIPVKAQALDFQKYDQEDYSL